MAPAVQEEVADMAPKDAQLHDQGQLPWLGAMNKTIDNERKHRAKSEVWT